MRTIRSIEWGLALSITALSVLLHATLMLHAGPLWRDEINSFRLATMPAVSDIWSTLRYDSFPMLFPLTLRSWIAVAHGDLDISLRLFGFLIGLATLAILWLNARRLDSPFPLLSMALIGLSPVAIRWGDSIRHYGLGVVLMLSSFGLIWKVTLAPTPRRILVAALVATLSVQCLYTNAFLVTAACLGGTAVAARNRSWPGVLALTGIGLASDLSLLPYMGIIDAGGTINDVLKVPFRLSRVGQMLTAALGSPGGMPYIWAGLTAVAILACVGSHLRHAVPDRRPQPRDALLFAVTTIATGMVGVLSFFRILSFPTSIWYYLPLMALVAVALDMAYDALIDTPLRRIVRMSIVVFIMALTFPPSWAQLHLRQTNVDAAAWRVTAAAAMNDMVVVNPWYIGVSFGRYYNGAAPWVTIPPLADLTIHRYDLLREQMVARHSIGSVLRRVAQALKSGNRVWVVSDAGILAQGQMASSVWLPTHSALPPRPQSQQGSQTATSSLAAEIAWGSQFERFIDRHGVRRERLSVSSVPVIDYEEVQLDTVEGWRGGH
jgi:uncharacterized membrane protein